MFYAYSLRIAVRGACVNVRVQMGEIKFFIEREQHIWG